MASSLSDILTSLQNGVQAINNMANGNVKFVGNLTSVTVTSPTVIATQSGRLVNYCVVVAGSGNGSIYNTNDTTSVAATNQLCATPQTIGVYPAGLIFTTGLVVSPGTGQSINVTYSLG